MRRSFGIVRRSGGNPRIAVDVRNGRDLKAKALYATNTTHLIFEDSCRLALRSAELFPFPFIHQLHQHPLQMPPNHRLQSLKPPTPRRKIHPDRQRIFVRLAISVDGRKIVGFGADPGFGEANEGFEQGRGFGSDEL